MKNIARSALLLLLGLCALSLVFGQNDDTSDHVAIRHFEVDLLNSSVSVRALSNNLLFPDRLDFNMDTAANESLIELGVGYHAAMNSTAEPDLSFRYRLVSLMEYVDGNANDNYDDGEEVFTYTVPSTWDAWFQNISTIQGSEVHNFTAVTADGVLKFVVHISDHAIEPYDTNGFKWDIEIIDFPFTRQNSTGLVFDCRIVSDATVSRDTDEDDPDHDSLRIVSNLAVIGRYKWRNFIHVSDDSSDDLHTNDVSPVGSEYRVFHYVNHLSARYLWDPELVAEYVVTSSSDSSSSDDLGSVDLVDSSDGLIDSSDNPFDSSPAGAFRSWFSYFC